MYEIFLDVLFELNSDWENLFHQPFFGLNCLNLDSVAYEFAKKLGYNGAVWGTDV